MYGGRWVARSVAITAIIFLVSGYFLYQVHGVVVGPSLEVRSPAGGATFSNGEVLVEGVITAGAELTVNGVKTFTDASGNFTEKFLFARGVYVLEIVVKDRFGKEVRVERQVYVE